MTLLEDFFTLTEMKDGLTAPARVKELVNVMQKEKHCIVKNFGDATRQWSTVASTIAATEDKDCLDLFIQLDGLHFIDKWLKDAQKFSNDPSDSCVEESINALLHALEKLSIDFKKSMSCGIWMTVKNLLGHSSSAVQVGAKALFDSWKQDGDGAAVPQVEKARAFDTDGIRGSAGEGGHPECSSGNISLSGESASEGKHVEPARDEMMPSMCSVVFHPERVDDVQTQTSDKEKTLDHETLKDECSSDPVCSSTMLEPVKENLSIKEESPVHLSEGNRSIETCTLVVPNEGVDRKSDVPESNECTDEEKQMQVVSSFPNKLGVMSISSVSSPGEPRSLSSEDATNVPESAVEPDLQNNIDTRDKDNVKDSPIHDTRMVTSEGKLGMDDAGSQHHCRSMDQFQNQAYDCNTNASLDSFGNEDKLQKPEDPDAFSTDSSGAIDGFKDHASDESEDMENDSNFSKPAMDVKDTDVVDKGSSDLELDAVDFARQVAIEVEREVLNRRERSSSSSEKILDGGRQPDSPESIHGKEIQPVSAASKEVPIGVNLSVESLAKGELLSRAKDLEAETENCIESSQVTEAAPKPEVNAGKCFGDFDLNEEICSEDMHQPVNHISTTISVVSASRAAAAPGFPVAPLQFEGAHGWKGSAATSAFRPASPRRTFEGDKALVNEGSHNSSKQRQDCLVFDLNEADAGDDKIVDLMRGKQILVSPGLPSGESSVEVSPRSERVKFDLNRISDDGDAPSDWRLEGRLFLHRNGHQSPSHSSSSSSMQPALRNFDLNESFYNDSSDLQPYLGKSFLQNLNASGGIKSDDSVISIMGTRVEVNRKNFVPQTPFLPNGRITEPALDINLARSGSVLGLGSSASYAQPSIFGYNGFTAGPTVPFSAAMYGPGGPIPYMVDSRGAPVVPQVVGSTSASPASFSQPPFVMSMIGTPPAPNGTVQSRPSFDLNYGLVIDGGNRESVGLRQFFNSGPSTAMDEHSRAQGGVGKRKEPDGGWEPFPFNYKRHQSPWK